MKAILPPRISRFILVLALAAPCMAAPEKAATILPGGAEKWTLVWADEFDYPDTQLDENWESQNGPSGHILCSRWRENARVADGTLRLLNKKEKRGGQEWTSGNIWTKRHFQYGYFECRYRYAAAVGTNNSFWLMTRGPDPETGKRFEIDINEGHYPNEINTNIHNWSDITVVNGKKTHPSSSKHFQFGQEPVRFDAEEGGYDFARGFHTFGLEWTEKELVFYFNGKPIRREHNDFCHSPAPIWLSLAIIKWAGPVTDAIDGTFMEVDHVRVYERKPGDGSSP